MTQNFPWHHATLQTEIACTGHTPSAPDTCPDTWDNPRKIVRCTDRCRPRHTCTRRTHTFRGRCTIFQCVLRTAWCRSHCWRGIRRRCTQSRPIQSYIYICRKRIRHDPVPSTADHCVCRKKSCRIRNTCRSLALQDFLGRGTRICRRYNHRGCCKLLRLCCRGGSRPLSRRQIGGPWRYTRMIGRSIRPGTHRYHICRYLHDYSGETSPHIPGYLKNNFMTWCKR